MNKVQQDISMFQILCPAGTFALTSLMLGNAMAGLAPDPDTSSGQSWDEVYDRRIQLATAIMFISGIFLVTNRPTFLSVSGQFILTPAFCIYSLA